MKHFLSQNIYILALLLCAENVFAQATTYTQAQHIRVNNSASKPLQNPWDGGTNSPQFAMADLDKDGHKDLVLFEASRSTVKTYKGQGSGSTLKYLYEPKYEKNFPEYTRSYIKLIDYNCDNIPDLFERGGTGFTIHRGYYNAANELSFTFFKAVYYNNINAYVDFGDIPEIVDIDGDGDLDLFAFNIIGGHINFYKNLRVEQNKPCDSFIVKHENACWGGVLQGYLQTQLLAQNCAAPLPNLQNNNVADAFSNAAKTTHSGNTLCFTDFNNNGIYDYFNGGVSYREIQFLTNGKSNVAARDTIIAQDTAWSADNHKLIIDLFPAAFWTDYDQDGDKDLIIAPHGDGTGDNIKSVNYYKNNGTATNPVWQYVSDSFFVEDHIDVGTTSAPIFYDYNKDGKPDLFVLGADKYIGNGLFANTISYYENNTALGVGSFTLKAKNFLNIETKAYQAVGLAIGDLNNDGKDDLVIGKADGTLVFYNNQATSANVQPNWVFQYPVMKTITNADIDIASQARPFIADVDNDGKKDLLIGRWDGYVSLYKNTGNTSALLTFVTHKYGQMRNLKNGNPVYNASVYYGAIDNSGKNYFLLGGVNGNLARFENPVGNTDPNATFTLLDTTYSNIYAPGISYPSVADVDADGKREMVIGNHYGGLLLFQQGISSGSVKANAEESKGLQLYPNPTKAQVTVRNNDENLWAKLMCYDYTGKLVYTENISPGTPSILLDLSGKAPGVYLIKLVNEKRTFTAPMILQP